MAGPLAFFAVRYGVEAWSDLSAPATAVLATTVWMALWWVTEAVPLAVTSLLPLVLFPLTGVMAAGAASAPYGDQVIFLFLGGFLIAGAVEQSGLHRRIALQVVHRAGGSPRRMVGGFMLASALLSMWISNSATAMMMLPVALSVAQRLRSEAKESRELDGFERLCSSALPTAPAWGASPP